MTHVRAAPRRQQRAARYRLSGTGAFEAVFRSGTRYDAHFLQLIAAPAARPPGRVGYVIGRKSIRNAVDRNRLRRRLRESVRAVRPAVEAFDVILRVRGPTARNDIAAAVAESRRLLARLVEQR
ncbi:MAG: ribonuclease P protein component [Rudaea sp.]